MPDLTASVHPPQFHYEDPVYQAAREEVITQAGERCPTCLRVVPLEAHHRTVPYPPADETTADDLMAICRDCHDLAHLFSFFLSTGGSPEDFRAAVSEVVAILTRPADDGRQVGRAVCFEDKWGALVTGASRPRVGEVFWLFLRKRREWRDVTVTSVVDGRPGSWRVRKRFLGGDEEIRLPSVNGGGVPAAALGECATPRHDENGDTTSQPAVPHMPTASTSRDSASACRAVSLT